MVWHQSGDRIVEIRSVLKSCRALKDQFEDILGLLDDVLRYNKTRAYFGATLNKTHHIVKHMTKSLTARTTKLRELHGRSFAPKSTMHISNCRRQNKRVRAEIGAYPRCDGNTSGTANKENKPIDSDANKESRHIGQEREPVSSYHKEKPANRENKTSTKLDKKVKPTVPPKNEKLSRGRMNNKDKLVDDKRNLVKPTRTQPTNRGEPAGPDTGPSSLHNELAQMSGDFTWNIQEITFAICTSLALRANKAGRPFVMDDENYDPETVEILTEFVKDLLAFRLEPKPRGRRRGRD
jgi:hypothetical protein